MNKQKFGMTIGIFDIISSNVRYKIKEEANKYETYALGVYTNEFIQNELLTDCMKTTQQRMEIAEQLADFVFPVDTRDSNEIKKHLEDAYIKYLERKKIEDEKKFKVGCIIGSFDLLHSGHIENIKLAKQLCEKLAVFVKTDERIFQNKHKKPFQSTEERAMILKELKPIDSVFYMDIKHNREDLIKKLIDFYGVKPSDIVVAFGSDLKNKEEIYRNEWEKIGVSIAYTERDPEKMKVISSSHYQQFCNENNQNINDLENREDMHIL